MDILIHLSKSVAILTIFYLVYWIVLRRDTHFTANRHFLLAGITSAILLPFIEFTKTVYVDAPIMISSTLDNTLSSSHLISQEEVFTINWWQIIGIVYFIGVTVMLIRFLKQLFSVLRLLKKYPSEKKGRYTYLKINENSAPFSFFNYIVYNPNLHSQEELEMILKHEQVHVSQRHSIDIVIAILMLILHWANPLAWLYKKSIEENLEFIADSATVQEVKSIKQYQLALVRASSAHPLSALTSNFYQSFIKKRIIMLNKSTSKKINIWKLSIILPFLALFLWSFNVKETIAYNEVSPNNIENPKFTSDFSESKGEVSISSEENVNPQLASDNISEIITDRAEKETSNNKVVLNNRKVISNDINITITKNTSLEELNAIKKELESQGISFDFKNVAYNENKEITAISLSYKDANQNSGNYSVSSDTAINTIRINGNEKGISLNSMGNGNHAYSRGENAQMRSMRREKHKDIHESPGELHEEDEEIHYDEGEEVERMAHRTREMNDRHEAIEVRRELHRDNMQEMRDKQNMIRKENRKVMREHMNSDPEHREIMREERMNRSQNRVYRLANDGKATTIIMPSSGNDREIIVIDKNTSNETLDKIKKNLADQDISFDYKKLNRNEQGEITSIKIDVENNTGSKTSTIIDGEGKGIDEIIIKL